VATTKPVQSVSEEMKTTALRTSEEGETSWDYNLHKLLNISLGMRPQRLLNPGLLKPMHILQFV